VGSPRPSGELANSLDAGHNSLVGKALRFQASSPRPAGSVANSPRALVLVKTFTTLPDVGQGQFSWLPVRWVMRNRFDSLAKIGRCRRPVFVAHGTDDGLVPYPLGRRLYDAANEPKAFVGVEGATHGTRLEDTFLGDLR
jgi:fermentation-respiration switch protein FrsA (DUF1100 family)